MNFFDTQMGHNFFAYQLPQLIGSMNQLTEALSHAPVTPTPQPISPDQDFLDRLYYGNLDAESYQSAEATEPLRQSVLQAQAALISQLTPEQRELFDTYQSIANARNTMDAEQAFRSGYRIAVQMLLTGLNVSVRNAPDNISAEGGKPHGRTDPA